MKIFNSFLIGFIFISSIFAQTHFTFTSNTGNNATVAVLTSTNPNIGGTPLSIGDEIGVFTPAGLCVGAVVWNGVNTAITVWGDNDQTPQIDGIQVGEQIKYRVWKQSTNTEYVCVNVSYSMGDGVYVVDGIYVLSSLSAVVPPDIPLLNSPANGSSGISLSPTLKWNKSNRAVSYRLQVSTSPSFSTLIVDSSGLTDTTYQLSGLQYFTTYYWKVSAENCGGTSDWSNVFNFTTILAAPVLHTPANGTLGVSTNPLFNWLRPNGAQTFRFQLSLTSDFNSFVVNQGGITDTFYQVNGLQNNTTYYWRVNASNSGGTSDWSSVFNFITILAAPQPISPENGIDLVSINPTLSWSAVNGALTYNLQLAGDSTFINLIINQTGIASTTYNVSNLLYNKTYFWRVSATNDGGTSSWSQIYKFTTIALQKIVLNAGWNMISGIIYPIDSNVVNICAGILPNFRLMKNGYGQSYWPGGGVNTIGNWNFRHGYQVYMEAADTLQLFGRSIDPQTAPINLIPNWNMISYLRNSPMLIDSALSGIVTKLVLAKNNLGRVYWPEYGINMIGNMLPGQGYQMYLTSAATLIYPPNSGGGYKLVPESNYDKYITNHYKLENINSNSNAILLVELLNQSDGDEVGVFNKSGKLVGSGLFEKGRAVVTIWGDDVSTNQLIEGAQEGENLKIKCWSKNEDKEFDITNFDLIDGISKQYIGNNLQFKQNAIWILKGSSKIDIPKSYFLLQNYPNPFNPSTIIKFGLPENDNVTLEIYDILGNKVKTLLNEKKPAGYYQIEFNANGLASGVYLYKLSTSKYNKVMKMIILR